MDSHELANWLLSKPSAKIAASTDVSTEETPFQRFFSDGLIGMQQDSETEITLIFETGTHNSDNSEEQQQ